jgi:hypothetical protein
VGANELFQSGMILRGCPEIEFSAIRSGMIATLLDGYGWRPLSSEHDYDEVRRRALSEVYAPEARLLSLLPAEAAAG